MTSTPGIPGLLAAVLLAGAAGAAPTPIIFDTDIGGDIDDTWALALALRCPEIDLKLVVGDFGQTEYRTRLIAKILQTAGRGDIPIGVGVGSEKSNEPRQQAWIGDYDVADYPGVIHEDGVQAMIDLIMASPEPVTLLGIGPAPNLLEALRREPAIATKARFVGMYGSVRKGYGGAAKISAEWNVRANPAAFRAVVQAPWEKVITPLDTCGTVRLAGEKYAKVRDSNDPLAKLVIANYEVWADFHREHGNTNIDPDRASSILFDTVAVYLCFATEFCRMETVKLVVDDEGFTREDPAGMPTIAALDWIDYGGFEDWLVERLTNHG